MKFTRLFVAVLAAAVLGGCSGTPPKASEKQAADLSALPSYAGQCEPRPFQSAERPEPQPTFRRVYLADGNSSYRPIVDVTVDARNIRVEYCPQVDKTSVSTIYMGQCNETSGPVFDNWYRADGMVVWVGTVQEKASWERWLAKSQRMRNVQIAAFRRRAVQFGEPDPVR